MSRRPPRPCEDGCGRPVRKRRNARFCSPCVARKPKAHCDTCDRDYQIDMMSTKTRCRGCASTKAHDKRVGETYGLKPGQYGELLAFQGGLCYICHRRPVSKRLAVDHDHQSGLVRGLLCRNCNRDVLGHLRDDADALRRAINYLEHTPAKRLWGVDVPKQPV